MQERHEGSPNPDSVNINTYAIVSASHLDMATVGLATRRFSTHVDIAERAGFDGIEAWPQGFTPRAEIRFPQLFSGADRVLSLHQRLGVLPGLITK